MDNVLPPQALGALNSLGLIIVISYKMDAGCNAAMGVGEGEAHRWE